ncbi:MAG TPA: hypothetical protein PKD16_02325 [Saprospiraceae bacterium]|jgi:hypothetical protein|nr:hypothetical protein [Saprospiraceae bacterium]
MRVQWHELEEFPDYAVSEQGDIANIKTGIPRKLSINGQGIVKITLYDTRKQLVTRSVARMVAEAFVPKPDQEIFDTPIHMDGELTNCRADNLVWRPRWFAIKYHRQFRNPEFHIARGTFIDIDSEEVYDSIKDICVRNGVFWQDVIKCVTEETFVFPTYQKFRLFEV